MAQPVFDGHPLEEYFHDSGEVSDLMPGGIEDIAFEPHLTSHSPFPKHSERMEKLCYLIFSVVESLSSFFHSNRMSLRTQAFAERFKYGVISSSLLSPAFPATPMPESSRRSSIPGNLPNSHSRTPSAADSTATDNVSLVMPPEPETPVWPLTLSFTVVIAAFSARLYFFALLLLAATMYYMHVHRLDTHSKPDAMTPSLLALRHLIVAGQLWDRVINDAFAMLENAERSIFHGSPSPLTPSSSLPLALSTSLLTTRTQCDNVRQLLSAITSPSELAQLAEMYAPPSPIKLTFARPSDSHRPLSHPGSPPRNTPQTDRSKKRSTWNGSYASLALSGTPPAFQAQRRERRRSDLSILLGNTSPSPSRTRSRSRNALSSPPQLLAGVSEEGEEGLVTAESSLVDDDDENSFGAAALGLYRSRVREGLRTLELPQRSIPSSLTRGNSTKHRTTMSPGSKYTSMHTTRHPFSLSSLRQSLQNALASKRFACSHLLALRFEDDEDEAYWEDVRSVMSLLTSTLVDASSRLSEILDEVEEQHLKMDDTASESVSGLTTPSSSVSPSAVRTHLPLSQTIEQIVSYAPTPSHLARFASHVDAISSALDDAREQLEQCVASLKERTMHSLGHSSHPSSCSGDVPPSAIGGAGTFEEPLEHPAVQAYERLRRELGLALRECERGRERLVHVVTPLTPSTKESPADDADDPTGVKSDDVKDASPPPPCRDDDMSLTMQSPLGQLMPLESDVGLSLDDATPHLLFGTSAAYLSPPGVEQVFEADSGGIGVFTRERSKLNREERIRLARVKRESAHRGPGAGVMSRPSDNGDDDDAAPPPSSAPPPSERGLWGPSGEVVQELKDVIWKVSERRRRMTASQIKTVVSNIPTVSRVVDVDVHLVVPQSAQRAS